MAFIISFHFITILNTFVFSFIMFIVHFSIISFIILVIIGQAFKGILTPLISGHYFEQQRIFYVNGTDVFKVCVKNGHFLITNS